MRLLTALVGQHADVRGGDHDELITDADNATRLHYFVEGGILRV